MIDYVALIKNLKVEKVIELMRKLGVEDYTETDEYVIFPTVCHNEVSSDPSKKLYYYKNSHLFVCYTNCGSQSIFQFLKHYYEAQGIEYDWYSDIYQAVVSCSEQGESFSTFKQVKGYVSVKDRYEPRKNRKQLEVYPNGLLDMFIKAYPVEWERDRISHAAMDKYNIRYSSAQNKIIIPHYDVEGRLVGIRGRALNEWEIENLGKYMPVQIENKWYAHPLSLNLYGFNLSKENIKQYGICYIGEAEKFCLQSDSYNFPNCSVAVCGSKINKYHIDLLLTHCHPKEIVICFDQEEKKGESEYFRKLWEMCYKYKNYANLSFVYDRQNLLKLKQSPTDCGEEVFKKLIATRVAVK